MRRILKTLIFSLTVANVQADHPTLKVFTWPEYFDPVLVEQFENETGTNLEFIYYDNDEIRDQVMAETQSYGFDIILVDDAELPAYIRQKWLQPINTERLPHLAEHGDQWLKITPSADGYAVPYGWGSYGIVYRKDQLAQPPQHWSALFDSRSDLAGAIQMPAQVSELIPVALMAAGNIPFNAPKRELDEAESTLLAQRTLVNHYGMPQLDAETPRLSTGEVLAAVSYNSDAMFLMEEDDRLGFVAPDGGNILWADYWAIGAHSHQAEKAHQFLDFLLRADVAARNVQYHYTATFSMAAKRRLPLSLQQDTRLFPENIDDYFVYQVPNRNTIRAQMRLINQLPIE